MNSTRTRLAEVLREAAAVLTYGFPPRSSLTARSSLIGELDRLALELEQPSDDLSLDEALLKRVTDAYAARFPVPAGYATNEVIGEVVRLIESAPAQQVGELPDIDVLGIFDQFGVQGLTVSMKLNIAHAILAARHPTGQPVKPSSSVSIAVIGCKHFGNPIPQTWYAAAKELIADCRPVTPVQASPAQQVGERDALRNAAHQMVNCARMWTNLPLNVRLSIDDLSTALAAPQPAQQGDDWRELARRLYVELFHCNQQMMSAEDEDGEPLWIEGVTVRDVLRDAKAALDTHPSAPHPVSDSAAQTTLAENIRTALAAAATEKYDECKWEEFLNVFDQNLLEAALATQSQAKPEKKNPADAEAEGEAVLGEIVAPAQAVPHDTLRAMRRAIPAIVRVAAAIAQQQTKGADQ